MVDRIQQSATEAFREATSGSQSQTDEERRVQEEATEALEEATGDDGADGGDVQMVATDAFEAVMADGEPQGGRVADRDADTNTARSPTDRTREPTDASVARANRNIAGQRDAMAENRALQPSDADVDRAVARANRNLGGRREAFAENQQRRQPRDFGDEFVPESIEGPLNEASETIQREGQETLDITGGFTMPTVVPGGDGGLALRGVGPSREPTGPARGTVDIASAPTDTARAAVEVGETGAFVLEGSRLAGGSNEETSERVGAVGRETADLGRRTAEAAAESPGRFAVATIGESVVAGGVASRFGGARTGVRQSLDQTQRAARQTVRRGGSSDSALPQSVIDREPGSTSFLSENLGGANDRGQLDLTGRQRESGRSETDRGDTAGDLPAEISGTRPDPGELPSGVRQPRARVTSTDIVRGEGGPGTGGPDVRGRRGGRRVSDPDSGLVPETDVQTGQTFGSRLLQEFGAAGALAGSAAATRATTGVDTRAATEPSVSIDTGARVGSDVGTDIVDRVRTGTDSRSRTRTDTDIRSEIGSRTRGRTDTDTRTDVQTDARTDIRLDTRIDTETDVRTDTDGRRRGRLRTETRRRFIRDDEDDDPPRRDEDGLLDFINQREEFDTVSGAEFLGVELGGDGP